MFFLNFLRKKIYMKIPEIMNLKNWWNMKKKWKKKTEKNLKSINNPRQQTSSDSVSILIIFFWINFRIVDLWICFWIGFWMFFWIRQMYCISIGMTVLLSFSLFGFFFQFLSELKMELMI